MICQQQVLSRLCAALNAVLHEYVRNVAIWIGWVMSASSAFVGMARDVLYRSFGVIAVRLDSVLCENGWSKKQVQLQLLPFPLGAVKIVVCDECTQALLFKSYCAFCWARNVRWMFMCTALQSLLPLNCRHHVQFIYVWPVGSPHQQWNHVL